MRTVHWLFVISVVLFICGIGFIVASARSARRAAPAVTTLSTTPVATVKQIMKAIVFPAATTIYKAVGSTETRNGTEEWAPKTDEEWETVANQAAALIESGNLLLTGNRVVDQQDWVKLTRMMIDGAKQALAAAEAKNAAGVMASGEPINNACDTCHERYERR